MPNIQIKIHNLPQIQSAFRDSPKAMYISLFRAITKVVLEIRDQEKSQYFSEGINVITGNLISSIQAGHSVKGLRGEVGPNIADSPGFDIVRPPWHGISHYAYFVHDGTKYMPARPFLLNAIENVQYRIDRYFTDAVSQALRAIASQA